ncbi:MAG: cytochrome c biogenesis protein ResB [Elusimicrobiales bacterium]|nr:cytochrome c biogenesis protein ResB [Elusimicrobiales bacterium]
MLKALASLRLFYVLCLALAGAFLYQTLVNRGAPVYGSWWFSALGALTAANIAACAFTRRRSSAHYLLIHAGLVVVIAGAFATRAFRFEASLPLRTGQASALAYSGRDAYKLPFEVKLEDFRLEYYREPVGVLLVEDGGERETFAAEEGAVIRTASAEIKVLRLARDFGLNSGREVVEKSPYWLNPAARLEIKAGGKTHKLWTFANFPGMHAQDLPVRVAYALEQAEIKNFTSLVSVKNADGSEVKAEIAVNRPLRRGGYTLYQTSYDPADARYSLLTVTRDRGAWVVYAGFALLLPGLLLWLRK